MYTKDFADEFNVKKSEIISDQIEDDGTGYRLVRLSFDDFGYSGIREMIAKLGVGGVDLHKVLINEGKNKHFNLAVEQMDKLAVEWIAFRRDVQDTVIAGKIKREEQFQPLRERAEKLGATLILEDYGEWYILRFPEGHDLHDYWFQTGGLDREDVLSRLDYAEKHQQEATK